MAVVEGLNRNVWRSKQQIQEEHMKATTRWVVAFAVISGVCLDGTVNSKAATSQEEVENATTMMNSYETQQRAAAEARQKDAAWKPSCSEVGLIQIGDSKKPGALKNFCLDAE